MRRTDVLRILLQISAQNLRSHKAKTFIVGTILFFGTSLWTVGASLVSSIEHAMSRSIIESVAGDLQVYTKGTRDDLALYGGGTFAAPDIGEIPSAAPVVELIESVPGVHSAIPMGSTYALLSNPSQLDGALQDLRSAERTGDSQAVTAATERVRYLIEYLKKETETRFKGQNSDAEIEANLAALSYALADTFWTGFAADPMGKLEFLDTRIAPIGTSGTIIYMSLLGVDIEQFTHEFPQFEIIEGQTVPPGERGFLLSEGFRDQIKNKVARELDAMKDAVDDGKRFADDEALRARVERARSQYKRILLDLNPESRTDFLQALRTHLNKDGDVETLLQEFLALDDSNFAARHAFFYGTLAPMVKLFPVATGDIVTMRAFTRSGYMRGANLKLYGLFRFKGMEKSQLAGAFNLVDMTTFREMYGVSTAAQRAELAAIRGSVGIEAVAREDAEAALFGGDEVTDNAAAPVTVAATQTPDKPDADDLALHIAVRLDKGVSPTDTIAALETKFTDAGQNLRAVPWQQAAGFVGQLTLAMRAVLIFGMVVIFLVALVVVNNTVVISTMERVREIGTLRAIGAPRWFVLWMFLLETATIAVVAGLLGAFAGAGFITLLGQTGIPAPSENVNFLFGGPRLYPIVGAADMVAGIVLMLTVSIVAAFIPARGATRVQPVEAMRGTE